MKTYYVKINVDYRYHQVEVSGDTPALLADEIKQVVNKFYEEEPQTVSPEEAMKILDEKIALVKKNGSLEKNVAVEHLPPDYNLELAAEHYSCRFTDTKYGHDKVKAAFFSGAEWQEGKMLDDAVERDVKVDAGGYPYIDATELYDYTEERPLAKGGDKVKIIILT